MQFLLLIAGISLLAEILGTIGGFGSSVFFVPAANFFFDFHLVLGVTAIFHLSSNISKIALFKKGIDWKLVFLIGIPAVIFVLIGALFSSMLEGKIFQLLLSIFLIALSLFFLIFKKAELKKNKVTSISGGIASGFLAGVLGSGGPIRGLTLAAYNLPKEVFIATSAFIDLGVDFGRSVVYISQGYVGFENWPVILVLIVVGFVGTFLGKIILDKIPQEKFKQIVLTLILIIGILSLFNIKLE